MPPSSTPADPFGTAALRAATLSAWRDSPTRLAEDVAAEAELRQIGYRDRIITELAANAADAAAAAAVPGRLRIRADGRRLHVANTGAPLTADGVVALAALRVSPKKSAPLTTADPPGKPAPPERTTPAGADPAPETGAATVGRFGVGFRATSPAERVDVLSVSGSITFDTARTRAELGASGPVPAQRLAWPLAQAPSPGYDTEVVLHLPDASAAAALVARARAEAGDLLLELPALAQIVVGDGDPDGDEEWTRTEPPGEVIVVRGGLPVARWLQAVSGGNRWLARFDDGRIRPLEADVLRSPTPTQIPLSLPARLICALPVTPDRRGLHPDADPADGAAGYAQLVAAAPAGQRHLLVPEPAFAAGPEDGVLRTAVLAELAAAAWVPPAQSGEPLLAPERTWILRGLTPELAGLLGGLLAPLAAPECSDGPAARALLRLGARELPLAELADLLSGVDREPDWWGRLYEALEPLAVGREQVEELGALPVPRADGRLHRGVRGLALVDLPPGTPAVRIDWVPVVHPDAHRPLLDRLGLEPMTIGDVLNHPALVQEVELADDHEELADAVLLLLDAAGDEVAVNPRLGALAVRTVDGTERAVDELLLPGSPLRAVLGPDAGFGVVDPAVVAAYGQRALTRLGAGWGFTVLTDELPVAPDHDLDAEDLWWDGLELPPERLTAVRDLDLVDPAAWPAALTLLAGDPAARAALTDAGGYTAWWLRRYAELDDGHGGRRLLRTFRRPDDQTWAGLFDPLEHPDAAVLGPLLAGAGPDDSADAAAWLAALAAPDRVIAPGVAARAHAALAAAQQAGRLDLDQIAPPAGLRTLAGTVSAEPLIVDRPWWLPVLPPERAVLVGRHPDVESAAAFATLADAPLASEVLVAQVVSSGTPIGRDSREACAIAAATGWELSGPLLLHEELTVAVLDGGVDDRRAEHRHTVARWRDEHGALHLARSTVDP